MKCQFCKKIFTDLEKIQLHQASNCVAMENESFVEPDEREITLRWLDDGGINRASHKVFLVLSDMVNSIELLRRNQSCQYESQKVVIQQGTYIGQIIIGHDSWPIKAIDINQSNYSVVLVNIETVEVDAGLSASDAEGLVVLNEAKGSVKGVGSTSHTQESGKEIYVNYRLNKKLALEKKITACERVTYEVKRHSTCCVVTFNTGAFEYFRVEVRKYLDENASYAISVDEPTIDKNGVITQDTIKVISSTQAANDLFTINLYRTTSKTMINGPKYVQFMNVDLPILTARLENMGSTLSEVNERFKESIPVSIDVATFESGENESIDNKGCCNIISTKRIRKRKTYEGFETTSNRRKTRNSAGLKDIDEKQDEDDTNEWSVQPKYWEKLGYGEWTEETAKECNRPKGCLMSCKKKNSDEMVGCDGCGRWCHIKCLVDEFDATKEDFLCKNCISRADLSKNQVVCDVTEEKAELQGGESTIEEWSGDNKDVSYVVEKVVDEVANYDSQCESSNRCSMTEGSMVSMSTVHVDDNPDRFLNELIEWYRKNNTSINELQMVPVSFPQYGDVSGNKIYYHQPKARYYGPEESPQVVIKDNRTKELEVFYCNEVAEFSEASKILLKKIQGSHDKELYSMIVKQKEKINELRMRDSMKMMPMAIINHINFLAKHVDAKERRIQELTEIGQKERTEIQELKRSKKVLNMEIHDANTKNTKLNRDICKLQKENELLKKENEKIKAKERCLEGKVAILENVAGDIVESKNHTVVIKDSANLAECINCPKMRKKVENLMKDKAVLNDAVTELNEKMLKIDKLHQKVVAQKDQTIQEYMDIEEGCDGLEAKFRRMLSYHKAKGELEHIQEIKKNLLAKDVGVDVSTNTEEWQIGPVNTDYLLAKDVRVDVSTNTEECQIVLGNTDFAKTNSLVERSVGGHYLSQGINTNDQRKVCWFGKLCSRKKCSFDHEGTPTPPECKYRLRCRKEYCIFRHADDCANRWHCREQRCKGRHIVVDKERLEGRHVVNQEHGESVQHHKESIRRDDLLNVDVRANKVEDETTKRINNTDNVSSNSGSGSYHDTRGYYNSGQQFDVQRNSTNFPCQSETWNSDAAYQYPSQNIYPVKRLCGMSKNYLSRWQSGGLAY